MAIDIVCKKPVQEGDSFKTMYGDRPYYFCSRKCEMTFVGNPLHFVDKSQSTSEIMEKSPHPSE